MKAKALKLFLGLAISLSFSLNSLGVAYASDFADVNKNNWAYEHVNKLRELNITDGIGNNNFGVGKTINRAEFVTFLCKLIELPKSAKQVGSFSDNQKADEWFFPYVEAALDNGIISKETGAFRPFEPITREEMAVMIVRALGYDSLATSLANFGSEFSDVSAYAGYITIAKDFGIVSGMDGNNFMPKATATREQAAAMLVSMYNAMNNNIEFKNAFYAINSSPQMQAINGFDSVSFGWGRLELSGDAISVNTTTANGNEYYFPSGFEAPIGLTTGKTKLLMLAVDNSTAKTIVTSQQLRKQAAEIIFASTANIKNGVSFDGVVIDFEGLKGNEERQGLNELLAVLREKMNGAGGGKIYVAVHPKMRQGNEYFDGYDYKTIGKLADKVILMAHDYNATQLTQQDMENGIVMTPVAPIGDVYYALKAITDKQTGVEDKSKVMLQLSFGTVQWKVQNGKAINQKPYTPNYDALVKRINANGEINYDKKSESPYIKFFNSEDSTDNVVWYEDVRSMSAKVKLAKLFGVKNISVWRLGNVPDYSSEINLNVLNYLKNVR